MYGKGKASVMCVHVDDDVVYEDILWELGFLNFVFMCEGEEVGWMNTLREGGRYRGREEGWD